MSKAAKETAQYSPSHALCKCLPHWGNVLKRGKLHVTRLPSSSRTRQPTPYEGQRCTSCAIHADRATRPAGKNLAIRGQTLIKKLNSIGACHAPNLITDTDTPALVSTRNGILLDMVKKYCACTG